MESRESQLIRESLESMNEDLVRAFKTKVQDTLKAIVADQKTLAATLKRIEDNKKLLKEMKLETLSQEEVL